MKKIYMLLSAAALCACALVSMPSQVSAQLASGLSAPAATPITNKYVYRQENNSRLDAPYGGWMDYWFVADSMAEENGNTPAGYFAYLFPDSTVITCSDVTCGRPLIHLIGNVLDPASADMQRILGYEWDGAHTYWVDSVRIFYYYNRKTNSSVTDTLMVYLWNDAVSGDIGYYYYAGPVMLASYGCDTVRVAILPYDTTGANMPDVSAGALKTFKIPLTESDTATIGAGSAMKVINTNHFQVPMGKLVASAWGFKPGYSYNEGDTITATKNSFAFISHEPNGTNTFPPYSCGTDDYNVSEIIEGSVRYNTNTSGYNGLFLPSFAFTQAYSVEEHLVSYYVTGAYVGLSESKSPSGFKLFQNQPNPSNHTTLIKYETQNFGEVTLEITDVTGRVVMVLNQGTQAAGVHSIPVDVTALSKGMYLYTLRTNNESLTRRMVISE